ncbi:MAG TPA: lytic transglycosylase domain-containing protein [Rhizomicrobium sp.]|nr:lytic transglycosylase domain-containing protein [Rhizomicrobium sp.]
MKLVSTLAITAMLLAGAVTVFGQTTTLPNGLTQQGSVVMMQPIEDYEGADNGISISAERHSALIHVLNPTDKDIFSRAFDAADRGDWTGARGLAAQGRDAAAKKLITWRYLLDKNSGATFDEINSFLKANPDWPARETLYARAEKVLDFNLTPQQIIAWFGSRAPASGIGKVRLGEAMIAAGRVSEGRDTIRSAWVNWSFEPDQELAVVQKDGAYLTPDSDKQRISNLIWREDIGGARRELSRVTGDVRQVAQARLTLRSNPSAGEAMAASLPGDLGNDPDLLFDRARTARRANDNNRAEALLLRALTTGRLEKSHPAKLWVETNIIVREALKDGNYRIAYQLLNNTNLSPGDEFSECEFMAGWVALRFLKEPKAAKPHFQKLEAGVSRPISLARAHYWEGRTYEAEGSLANAYEQYRLASKAPTTFYGQLALAKIDATPILHVVETPLDATTFKAEFDSDELAHAMKVLGDLGQVSLLRMFALRYEELHPDAKHVGALLQAMADLGFREVALRAAKQASYNGILYLQFTHPVISVPAYHGPGNGPDPAMTLGLIRQETEFDPAAVSGPGARGLMQIMPAGARHDADLAGVAYRPNDLLSDPTYNMQLGMAEFGSYISNWGGSLTLSMAAYNAGATNAKKWVTNNGDPRSPATDPIDWIEEIPFNETRNYLMRVLENTQIYRNRLSGRDQPLRILNDLYAPNAPSAKVLDYTPPPQAPATLPVPEPKPNTAP